MLSGKCVVNWNFVIFAMSDPEIVRKETPNVGHGSSYCGNTEVEAKFPEVLCLFCSDLSEGFVPHSSGFSLEYTVTATVFAAN